MDAQSEAACQRTDVPTMMQQSEAVYQRTDVPTMMQQSEAAYQWTDVPTMMQQSEAAYQRTDVPSTMSSQVAQVPGPPSPASEPLLDDKTLQEVAKRLGPDWVTLAVELGFTMVQVQIVEINNQNNITRQGLEMLVAWTHAQFISVQQQRTTLCTELLNIGRADIAGFLQEPRLDDKTLQEVAKRLGPDWVTLVAELGFEMVQVHTVETNYKDVERQGLEMLVAWTHAQSTGVEQQRTTLCTALLNIGRADIAGFLQGVPAPRPQLSQRPDQEPRLGASGYQDVGNKTRDILKEVYKTTGSYVQLLPRVDDDQMHISSIYTIVRLETREGVAVVTGKKRETVNSTEYVKIFRLRTRTGELIKRLIFFGMGGVGKSTIFDKIVYDWADEAIEILNRFKLVFLLEMCALSQESDLVDSIFDQLLGEDSGIAKYELDQFILANQNEVLILLDGFDEMRTNTFNAASFGSILKSLNRKVYRECVICVTTRPSHLETLMSKSLVQNPCTHVEVLGFTDEDVHEYIQKFYDEDPYSGRALIQTIRKSNTLSDFARKPMLLLLMCLLWRKSKQLPETTSRLFTETVNYMFTRKRGLSGKDASKILIDIGKTALRGLMSANQKFSFQEDEFEPTVLNLALKLGILTRNLKSHNIQFMQKTMQEYCASKYLHSLEDGKFPIILSQLCSTVKVVVSNDFFFRFCCGDNAKCMTDIVNLLDHQFNTDEPRYQSVIIQAISRNCFFESQSEKVPQGLTIDSLIPSTVDVINNDDFRSLMYLLEIIGRSESRTAQLARIETINVSLVSSVSDLAFALGYMENLGDLSLNSCYLVNGDLEKILPSLKCNKFLTSLDIRSCYTLGGRAVEWAPYIKYLASLNKLEIRHCKLLSTDIEHIASAVGDMHRLTHLILYGNEALGRTADIWAKELPKMTQLNRLDLGHCSLTPTDIKRIAWAVCDMPRLTDLYLGDNRGLVSLDELQSRFPLHRI